MNIPDRLARHTRPRSELYGWALYFASRAVMFGAFAVFCVLKAQGAW